VELADSVSMAMLLVLETLAPTERAVFVLREVFDLGYDDIARAVDKTPAAVRQIAHRARTRVAARRPHATVSAAEAERALDAFQRAVETGDLQGLLDVLSPDVVLLTDGGGLVRAALAPITGAEAVAAVLRGVTDARLRPAQVNGRLALLVRREGETEVDSVMAVRVAEGLVAGLYVVRNPEKLSRLEREVAVSRGA
ncbi:sigma factor-like helix-turn-helix DNA-binding protein, partial [Glycomyces tenuis]